mgnify:CR=1 FL=1
MIDNKKIPLLLEIENIYQKLKTSIPQYEKNYLCLFCTLFHIEFFSG